MGGVIDDLRPDKLAKSLLRFHSKATPHSLIMGSREAAKYDLAGQVTGAWDKLYKPKAVTAAPVVNDAAEGYAAADRMRRRARLAQGQASTIRTSPQGAPYDGAPKTLLGS